ncbi:MAG: hypothetical protein IJ570_09405 [Prevotella sp.]|nr:hypothetical protein [Prevotella sp.]
MNIRRILVSFLVLTLSLTAATADDKEKYQQLADQIRSEVWSRELPAFSQRSCPDSLKGHSAVVLACYCEVNINDRAKINAAQLLFFGTLGNRVNATSYTRRLVAVNDEQARQQYAEFDFASILRSGFDKVQTVVGVRIVKPSGEVREVSTDDYVIANQGPSNRQQRRKLAVPDLQVGDLIDYFYCTVENIMDQNVEPFVFKLSNTIPVLSYQVHCVVDPSMNALYRTLNGAPDFDVSSDKDGNLVLDLEVKEPGAVEPALWYSAIEQSPIVVLNVTSPKMRAWWTPPSTRQRGLLANPYYSLIVDDDVEWRQQNKGSSLTGKDKKLWQQYCNRIAAMDITKEERVARLYTGLYYLMRFSTALLPRGDFFSMLGDALRRQGITTRQLYTTSSYREPIDQLVSYRNSSWGLYVQDIDRVLLRPTYDMSPFTIPTIYQGRKAVLDSGNGELITLPKSTAADNQTHMVLKATIDGTTLNVSRRNAMTGAEREEASKALVMSDQMMEEAFSYLGINRTLTDIFGKKYRNDVEEAIRQMHQDEEQFYTDEATGYHGTPISQLKSHRLENIGFRWDSDTLIYSSTYTIDGLVKRAGNNLVLAVGQLLSQQRKIEGSDRERNADICYGQTACEARYDITVTLPEGYVADSASMAALNTEVSNTCGTFSVQATTNGSELLLTAIKRYNHDKEPREKWPEVLQFIDAASAFNAAQIILRKQN